MFVVCFIIINWIFSAIFDIRANAFCNDILEQCTFCMTPENRYNLGVSRVIDHMLYQGYESVVSSVAF